MANLILRAQILLSAEDLVKRGTSD